MGCVTGINHTDFPKQGEFVNKDVEVMFHYKEPLLKGTIVRDDMEQPFITIIRLADGRHILGTECQYKPPL